MLDLHRAAAMGQLDEAQVILKEHRNDPNERDLDWALRTPLHWAACKGHTDIAKILIEYGARTCLRTECGKTPAHFAAQNGYLAMLQLLHHHHAPMDKKDVNGDKPVRLAEMYGHDDCALFLKRAENECQEYRKVAANRSILLDDSDEEWEHLANELRGPV